MNFAECVKEKESILMEGALGERLKREFRLTFDENIAMAGLVYSADGRKFLRQLWLEYAKIALSHGLPFLATTPTHRTNQERVDKSCYDASVIRANVDFLREAQKSQTAEMYVGGLLGCKGDAYTGQNALTQPCNRSEIVHTRFSRIQANISPLPYEVLDHAVDLKTSEPIKLAEEMASLRKINPIKIFGGCCGTDGRHIEEISKRVSMI